MPKKKSDGFSASDVAQPVFRLLAEVIRGLSNEQAMEVLEEVSCHVEAMAGGIQEDMERVEDDE